MIVALRDGRVRLDDALVERSGRASSLSPTEQRLLRYLAERAGRICSREELLAEVWGYRPGVVTRTIDTTVRRLREKIEVDPAAPEHLLSVYGRGLRLLPAETTDPGPDPTLFGRERELETLLDALRAGVGWIEIVGPPGSGRTRVASELMRRSGGRLVRRIDLRTTRTALAFDAQLSNAFRLTPVSADRIGRALAASGPLLAVFDGCDTIAGVIRDRIVGWLAQAPALVVVTVSAIPLGPSGVRVALGPLGLAASRALHRSIHGPGAPVARGALPLALELDAADAPDLDAAIARAIDALPPAIFGAARALAAFCGPVDLDDVEGVLGPDALPQVQVLAERRLLRIDDDAYELHDAVSAWIWATCPPDPDAIERHGAWFGRLGDGGWSPDRLPRQRAAVAELSVATERCAVATRSRCLAALVELFSEDALPAARDEALARLRALPSIGAAERATAARVGALAATDAGEPHRALADLDAALGSDLAPEHRWRLRLARLNVVRSLPGASAMLDEAEALEREPLPTWLAARTAVTHAFVRFAQNLDPEPQLLRGRALARRVGDTTTDSIACDVLSHVLLRQGRISEAAALSAASLVSPTAPRNELHCLVGMAQLELYRGELEAGDAALARAELIARVHGEPSDRLQVWRLRAVSHALRGELDEAEEVLLGLGDHPPHPALPGVWNTLADVRLLNLRIAASREAYHRALELAATLGLPRFAAQRRSLSAVFALIDRRFDAARAEAREVSELLEPFPRLVHDAQFAFAEARWGDPGRASEQLRSVEQRAARFELGPRSGVALWSARARAHLARQ